MRILCLILASDGGVYDEFQAQWRRYMNSHPDIDCFFYKGDPTLTEEAVLRDKNTLVVRHHDGEVHGVVYPKTLMAFDYFLPKLNQYQFVFRPNLSSFIHFQGLIDWCRNLTRHNTCSAFVGYHSGTYFPAGAGIILTPDLVRRLCEERPPEVFLDDVTIGAALSKWGIPIVPAPRIDNSGPRSGIWHYRLKTEKRERDVALYGSLVDFFYPTK